MNKPHSLQQQMGFIFNCLSQGNKPLGMFIAAGCPLSIDVDPWPLIPDIGGLTSMICDDFVGDTDFEKIVNSLAGRGQQSPNIEQILSYIRSIQSVSDANGFNGITLDSMQRIERRICDLICVSVNKDLPLSRNSYHQLAKWVSAIGRTEPVEIFTTNYDLLMEQALEANGVPYFDGFIGSKAPFYDPLAMEIDILPPRWARLWKLHGSINWYVNNTGISRGPVDATGGQGMIYPSHLKYDESRKMPYLAMIDRLKVFLKKPSATLFICGYSFGDTHINEVIEHGLHGNPTASAFGLLYGSLSRYPSAVKMATSRANLSLFANDSAIIGMREAAWSTQTNGVGVNGGISMMDFLDLMPADGPGGNSPSCKLGDFKEFGRLLSAIIGNFSFTVDEVVAV